MPGDGHAVELSILVARRMAHTERTVTLRIGLPQSSVTLNTYCRATMVWNVKCCVVRFGKDLVAAGCNAPNAFRLPFRIELKLATIDRFRRSYP